MKHKLLLLGAFLMASMSISAQNFTANRTKSVPEFTTWAMEDTCYLWNVGAQGYYTNHQGARVDPYWGTRAIVSDTIGQKVVFSRTNPGGTDESWDADGVLENTCLLTSYVSHSDFRKFYCTFADGWNGIWTDNNGNAYRYFNVIEKGQYINIERNLALANGGEESEGKYLGILASDYDKTLKLHDTEAYINEETEETYYNIDPSEEFWEDWAIVSPDAYQAWLENGGADQAKLYATAASLKAALEKAYKDNPGINTLDAPIAVYNNMSATVEELKEAEASIQGLIIEYLKHGGSVENPVDFTSAIVNSTFDTIGDFTGWSFGEGTNQFGAGGATAPMAEVWRGSFDGYQDIDGLPEGVYMLSVNAYCRYNDNHVDDYNDWKSGNPTRSKLYMTSPSNGTFSNTIKHISEGGTLDYTINGAGNTVIATIDDIEYTLYTPNSMYEANGFFHEEDADGNPTNRYRNEVMGALGADEIMRIGVTNPVTADWTVMDDFQLIYYGNELDAYQFWGTKLADSNNISFEGSFYGKPEKDLYEATIATLKGAETKEEILAAISDFNNIPDTVATSKANYKEFVEQYNKVLEWLGTTDVAGDLVNKLSDYLQADAGDIDEEYPNGVVRKFLPTIDDGEGEGTLSAEEIKAETEYMLNLQAEAITNGMKDGTDMTDLIINPSFEIANGYGWSLDTSKGGTSNLTNWHGGNAGAYCAEAYQQKFDVYQIINKTVQNGLYEVSVQAYYRGGWPDNAYAAYLEDPEMTGAAKVPTYVYFNEFATPVRNVMEILYTENLASNCSSVGTDEDGNTLYALNGMASASTAFSLPDESQNFTMKVYGLVTDGKIRLGIRNLTQDGEATWSLWDNFKLTYRAKNPEALAEVINNYLLRAQEVSDCGTPEKTALNTAITDATAAVDSGDGNAMYDALIDLVNAINAADESASKYEKASALLLDLNNAYEEYYDSASDEALANAEAALNDDGYAGGISLRSYGNDKLDDVISALEGLISALKVPDYSGASDDNPVDFTSVIVNPSYDDANDDGWEGSTKSHSGFNRQDMNEYYYAAFDHHQTLKNLPAGTYELTLNCFNRIPGNNAQTDLDSFEAGEKNEKMAAFVYATVGDQTFAEPFYMISEPKRTEWVLGGTNNASTSKVSPDTYYTPNNMTAAGDAFEETDDYGEPLSDVMNYRVRVVFTLTEDGDVTIGCKNSASDTWAIWDNWTLTYFGTESEKTDSGDATGVIEIVDNSSVLSTEIFTVGGARVNTLQRGVNIVKTQMSDGTVKIKKVYVK